MDKMSDGFTYVQMRPIRYARNVSPGQSRCVFVMKPEPLRTVSQPEDYPVVANIWSHEYFLSIQASESDTAPGRSYGLLDRLSKETTEARTLPAWN